MKAVTAIALAISLGMVSAAATASDAHQHQHSPGNAAQEVAGAPSEGEIKKVSKESGKLTIKHGELKNLGMPPMTMVFRVKDAAMLDQVKAGDKIGFVAEKINGQLTVTRLEVRQ